MQPLRRAWTLTKDAGRRLFAFFALSDLGNTSTTRDQIKDFAEVGVKAIGDYELVCTLESPAPYFPDVVKHTTWLCPS